MTMDWNQKPQRAPGIEMNEVTDGFVASRQDDARIHYLNPSAAFILEICDGTTAASELPELLAAAFDLAAPPVEDVERCLAALMNEGLLVDLAPPTSRTP